MSRRIAIVVSHPIQHFCPQYVSWSNLDGVEIRVLFGSRYGLEPYMDHQFNRVVQWETLNFDFPHEFLPGASTRAVEGKMDCVSLDVSLAAYCPDVIVVYGYIQRLQRRAMRWAKSTGRRLVMIADSELRGRRSSLKHVAKKFILPRMLAGVDAFLTVGDANEHYYRTYGVDDRRLIRCSFPIDISKFDAAHREGESVRAHRRATWGVPQDHVVLLMVGKLVSWKRQRDLVELANRVRQGRPLTVVLAGTGPDEALLRGLARVHGAGGVIFAGFVAPAELVSYYEAADIYVHCSEREPHSLAISEAIYCGLPVVVSDRCGSYGPTDDVRVGSNGFVFRCGDVDEMEDAILAIADDPRLRASMRTASRRLAIANQSLAHGEALIQALNVICFVGAK